MTSLVKLVGTPLHRTKAAMLFENDEGVKAWIPFSLIEDETEDFEGVTIIIPEWAAMEKGLI